MFGIDVMLDLGVIDFIRTFDRAGSSGGDLHERTLDGWAYSLWSREAVCGARISNYNTM